jgi:hypothetical protein
VREASVRGLFQEGAELGDPLGAEQVEVDAGVHAALAEVAVQRSVVSILVVEARLPTDLTPPTPSPLAGRRRRERGQSTLRSPRQPRCYGCGPRLPPNQSRQLCLTMCGVSVSNRAIASTKCLACSTVMWGGRGGTSGSRRRGEARRPPARASDGRRRWTSPSQDLPRPKRGAVDALFARQPSQEDGQASSGVPGMRSVSSLEARGGRPIAEVRAQPDVSGNGDGREVYADLFHGERAAIGSVARVLSVRSGAGAAGLPFIGSSPLTPTAGAFLNASKGGDHEEAGRHVGSAGHAGRRRDRRSAIGGWRFRGSVWPGRGRWHLVSDRGRNPGWIRPGSRTARRSGAGALWPGRRWRGRYGQHGQLAERPDRRHGRSGRHFGRRHGRHWRRGRRDVWEPGWRRREQWRHQRHFGRRHGRHWRRGRRDVWRRGLWRRLGRRHGRHRGRGRRDVRISRWRLWRGGRPGGRWRGRRRWGWRWRFLTADSDRESALAPPERSLVPVPIRWKAMVGLPVET